MVRREIAPTSQALQVAFSRLFREPMLSESTSFGSRWGIYEMSSTHSALPLVRRARRRPDGVVRQNDGPGAVMAEGRTRASEARSGRQYNVARSRTKG